MQTLVCWLDISDMGNAKEKKDRKCEKNTDSNADVDDDDDEKMKHCCDCVCISRSKHVDKSAKLHLDNFIRLNGRHWGLFSGCCFIF